MNSSLRTRIQEACGNQSFLYSPTPCDSEEPRLPLSLFMQDVFKGLGKVRISLLSNRSGRPFPGRGCPADTSH